MRNLYHNENYSEFAIQKMARCTGEVIKNEQQQICFNRKYYISHQEQCNDLVNQRFMLLTNAELFIMDR